MPSKPNTANAAFAQVTSDLSAWSLTIQSRSWYASMPSRFATLYANTSHRVHQLKMAVYGWVAPAVILHSRLTV